MRTLGRLLRLSLAPSAVADIAAGMILGAGWWPGGFEPFLLLAATLCVYHGGMALNDWADRVHDGETRPDRPIPSGRVPAGAAALLGFTLLLAGPWIALGAARGPALILGGVAVLAAVYDLYGRGAWLGPLLLGLCRAGNLGAGLYFGRLAALDRWPNLGEPGLELAPIPLLYGGYVFVVSCLGRLEDAEDARPLGRRPSFWVAAAAALMLALPILPVPVLGDAGLVPPGAEAEPSAEPSTFLRDNRITLASLVVAAGAFGLLRAAFRQRAWTRPEVMRTMGMALRRLLVFTAGVAVMRGTAHGLAVAAVVLLGYPLSYGLRRVFPPS
ncbi:MAG: UbiA family prenyltransferase [Planctomycetota bacterium]